MGFVPTMGAFHEGHRSLMRRAKDERDVTVVSIFVNPLQFGDARDLETYPRDEEADLAAAEREEVDLVFAPSVDEMYPGGEPEVTVDPGPLGERFEGASRPGHFRGVATVVAKLFAAVGPSAAYFGEKDAQQLAVVRRMVRDLSLPVEVALLPGRCANPMGSPCRAATGSCHPSSAMPRPACSSRSRRRPSSRAPASATRARLVAAMAREIGATPLARIDYVAVVDEDTFEELPAIDGSGPSPRRGPLRRGAVDRHAPAPHGVSR